MQNRTPIAKEARPPLPEFTPVPRKYRHDGWTPERQRAFIAALADTGSVRRAAAMVNMAQTNCYTLRRAAGAEGFRRAWEAALDFGVARLKDIAFERAIDGYLVPVFVAGKLMGFRRRHNDALLMFCLRHYGQDAGGKRTVINYFSTRASAGAVAGASPMGVSTSAFGGSLSRAPAKAVEGLDASGNGAASGAVAAAGATGTVAEASTTTVRTVIHGGAAVGAGDAAGGQDEAAALIEGFEGAALDAQAEAEIGAALLALAARQRALYAAMADGGPEAIDAQLDDPGIELVRVNEKNIPLYGPLQTFEGLADAEPVQRFAGEAEWVEAGGDIPEKYREWLEGAEARGERTSAVPLASAADDGVAAVKKRPSWRQARKAKAAKADE
ncbi:hypothetical protein GGR90_001032 [Sphingopyxis italica]|uniref:Terminase n=1 Tax=Sphingopyxis italica TaxID=1129133 RepID=A0A7X6B7Q4_9SPHN|nr:hypothetical protein [Sphingopyxis italica]NJB88880.1 hypothetical protein [Sphingopyxis italica]